MGLRRSRSRGSVSERVIGIAFLVLLIGAFLVVPVVSSYGTAQIVGLPEQAPSIAHLFGTDQLGRDVFTRTFEGGRTDVLIAALATVASLVIGTVVGVMIGLTRRNFIGTIALRVIDAVLAIPFLILVLSMILVLGSETRLLGLPKGVGTVVVVVVAIDWAIYARLAFTTTKVLRDREFVQAARLLGFSYPRIITRHIVPNVLPTTGSYAASDAVLIIVSVASLAFLGSGIQEPTPEIGNIMFQGHDYLATSWWITVLPGVVLVALGCALALVADSFGHDD